MRHRMPTSPQFPSLPQAGARRVTTDFEALSLYENGRGALSDTALDEGYGLFEEVLAEVRTLKGAQESDTSVATAIR